jgi:hypothetical protein
LNTKICCFSKCWIKTLSLHFLVVKVHNILWWRFWNSVIQFNKWISKCFLPPFFLVHFPWAKKHPSIWGFFILLFINNSCLHLYKFWNLLDPRYCPPMPKVQVQTHFLFLCPLSSYLVFSTSNTWSSTRK